MAINNISDPKRSEAVAIVTGAAGILGPGICEELQYAGWKVAGVDYSTEKFSEFEKINHRIHPADFCIACDLARRSECFRVVQKISEQLGPPGLLINNATGQVSAAPSFRDMDETYCDGLLRVDLLAPIYLAQAAHEALAANRGLIVNMSSVLINNLGPGRMMYTAAKAAAEKLTESLAQELAPQGIRVNALRIGSIAGDAFLRPALQKLPRDLARRLHDDIMERHFSELACAVSLTGRVGVPADAGKMIAYLASAAGEFINGAVIPIDGGFSLLQQQEAYSVRKGLTLVRQWLADPEGETRKWLREQNISYEV